MTGIQRHCTQRDSRPLSFPSAWQSWRCLEGLGRLPWQSHAPATPLGLSCLRCLISNMFTLTCAKSLFFPHPEFVLDGIILNSHVPGVIGALTSFFRVRLQCARWCREMVSGRVLEQLSEEATILVLLVHCISSSIVGMNRQPWDCNLQPNLWTSRPANGVIATW